ncbi:Protein FAR-RED IMPAIRED RESPONSE 1 [Acorus gramineus]|uniref:Protein FAR-RED IMPAIRED RESPONSE 1 n=1 Tax=Acorus gramineus TaxID=55184 RepID=A0AAV9BUX3_ACOGR|nr:Protein FAR-RED IMPAIRED RESPONSE 1 [Acorus gramineus]
MEFDCEESAYDFYNAHARLVGFNIRRSDASKSNGITRRHKFCCSKEGTKAIDKQKVKNPQPDTRTGCGAHMIISYQPSGTYQVIKFEPTHNHDIVPSPLRHNLRSHRKIEKIQASQVDVIDSSGLAPKTVVDLMSQQVGGRKNLGFTLNDVKNYLRTKRERRMENGIAGALIEYFKKKQKQNPSFFHSMQLDADEQITNVFWADARSIVDYAHFGDVLCFDTTYRTNNHGMPFAPFVGVTIIGKLLFLGVLCFMMRQPTHSFGYLKHFLKQCRGEVLKLFLQINQRQWLKQFQLLCLRLIIVFVYGI